MNKVLDSTTIKLEGLGAVLAIFGIVIFILAISFILFVVLIIHSLNYVALFINEFYMEVKNIFIR